MSNFFRRSLLILTLTSSLLLSGGAGGWERENSLPLFLSALLLSITYLWAKELVGRWWAFIPVFFTAFSPVFLSAGTHETAAAEAVAINAALLAFLGTVIRPSLSRAIVSGIALGAAMLLAPESTALLPVFAITAIGYHASAKTARFKELIAVTALGILIFAAGVVILGLVSNGSLQAAIFAELESSMTGTGRWQNLADALSTETLPSMILIAAALLSGLARALTAFMRAAFSRSKIFLEYLETHIAELSMIALILFWIRSMALDAQLEPTSSLLVLLPSAYILATEALRRHFSLDEARKVKNIMLKISILREELIQLSVKTFILMIIIIWHLTSALIAAPDFSDYRNILEKIL